MLASRIGRSPLPSLAVWALLLPPLALDCVRSKRLHSYAGPFITYLHTWKACPSNKIVEANFRPGPFSRSRPYDLQTLSGNLTIRAPFTDRVWTETDLAVWANNQWKENAFKFPFPKTGCSELREQMPDFFRVVAKHTGASTDLKDPCVVPVGHSVLKDEPVNWTFPNFPTMPYGRYRYRMRSRLTRNSPIVCMCVAVDCEVIPKP
ncbi:uncharacterized protein LOC117640443 [Thrips palmi]|uniref:Uncharacterized protein LOC117640443 n=1 Tax=Thrips palmi TaxID=161013 RepID=A0A6P8Y9L6_THRPL|nr:uncharacterized protein LOC117640443 [Thrips palmi]